MTPAVWLRFLLGTLDEEAHFFLSLSRPCTPIAPGIERGTGSTRGDRHDAETNAAINYRRCKSLKRQVQ